MPLQKLLISGHEYRLTHLYRMCGTVLGSQRKTSKLIPSTLALPREHFTRKSQLVGFPRISCDLMIQAAFALQLGKPAVAAQDIPDIPAVEKANGSALSCIEYCYCQKHLHAVIVCVY